MNSTGTRPIRSKLVLGRAVISIFQYTVSSFPRHAEFLSIPPPRARISVRNGPCIDTTQPTDRKTDPDSLRLAENQRERERRGSKLGRGEEGKMREGRRRRGGRIRGGEKQSGIGTGRNETRRNKDAPFGDGGWSWDRWREARYRNRKRVKKGRRKV